MKRPSLFSFDGLDSGDSADGSRHRPTLRMALPENLVQKFKSHGLFGNQSEDESSKKPDNSVNTVDALHVLEVVEDFPSAAKQYTAAALSPSARTSYQSKVSKSSAPSDSYATSGRGSAIDESVLKVNLCTDDAYGTAQDHVNSLMGELMLDFTENPSLVNQKMVVIQSEFPNFVIEDFESINVPQPDSYPVPLTPTTDHPVVAPMEDFQAMPPMDEEGVEEENCQIEDEIADPFQNFPLQGSSSRSTTLVSVDEINVDSDDGTDDETSQKREVRR
ncbi:MAG: hypothetical protein SGILL_004213 [Bacillariaceae sp.]